MSENLTAAQLHSYYQKIYDQALHISNRFLIGFFVFSLLLAFFYQSWFLALGIGGGSLLTYFILLATLGNVMWSRYLISFMYGNFVLLFILQMKGLYEMYFSFFFALTLLLFFENWKVLVPLTVHGIVSILILYELQNGEAGVPEYLSNGPEFITTTSIFFHIGFMLAFFGLCALWAIMQRKQTEESAINHLRMDAQLKTMEVNIAFADSISRGQLQEDYPSDQKDRLGEALINMRKNLLDATEREEKDKFRTLGLAEIGEILRKNADSLENLCDQVLEKLVRYLKANQGSVFIMEENQQTEYLQLMASRAWDRKKYLTKRIEIGEGLVGEAAIEKETIFLKNIPKNYIQITSGLGEANPNCILIVPLKSEEQVVGVIELASFKIFSENEKQFLEKVAESIAATIITTKNNQRNKELLEKSKLLTEQLKAQEEEIRQNLEEMQATQEEMARAQREVQQKATELQQKQDNLNSLINNTDDSILAMDTKYQVMIMNDVLKRRYKGTQYENLGVGSDALSALGAVRDEWKGYYDKALAGEKLDFTIKSTVKGEDAYREYFINPMREHNGTIVGLSVFSRDVTEKHRILNEMTRKGAVLDSIINHESDTYFAIDTDFKIIVINKVLQDRFKAGKIELNEGDSILEKLPQESLALWKGRYEKALGGERLKFSEERKLPDKTLFLEVMVDPIYNAQNEIIGCSTVSRDITHQKKVQGELEKITAELASLKLEKKI